eukprot:CAMPEP_0194706190 /NCGR_PEP_ID=MMETSP0295-20121207/29412_1 /TAXON_ID=39354 /ORGANISM="Heterosigma akashiwo, Strain CCMP2393" /LENGTH=36 /DNA_ID= /DNA_START= /DNA_END= /DNA_ORIENTATION=
MNTEHGEVDQGLADQGEPHHARGQQRVPQHQQHVLA